MKIQGYAVTGAIRIGVSFHQKNKLRQQQLFFWSPPERSHLEIFAKWTGHTWQMLPIDRIPEQRKTQLVEFWSQRGQRKP